MNNFEMIKFAEGFLGQGGSVFRAFAGLGSGQPWCAAFVSYIFHKSDNKKLFCDGQIQTYCPSAIKWCYDNLALLPMYLVMPGDIIFFDWQPNGRPDHIGLVEGRVSDLKVSTIEGNTSGSTVDTKTRAENDVQGVFRPHFKPTGWSSVKKLDVDGYFGYNTIAVMQRALKESGYYKGSVNAVLNKSTVKALQKYCGVKEDGWWGPKTSKSLQTVLKGAGVYSGSIDGYFGPKSVKAMQKWLNDPLRDWYEALRQQYEWSKNQTYNWVTPTIASSKKEGTCVTLPAVALQRLGLIPSKGYVYINMTTHKITGRSADYVKKHTEFFTVLYPNKTWKDAKLKKGDIVAWADPAGHIMVYMGKDSNGHPLFDTMGHTRGLNIRHSGYENRKINMIVRLKKVR